MNRPSVSRPDLVMVGVVVGGIVLRVLGIDRTGLFLDESWSWAFAKQPYSEFVDLARSDLHPPFYYLVLKGWLALVPVSEAVLRLPSALFSALSLILLAWFTRRWWGTTAATCSALLLGLSTFDLQYAQDARMYTLLAFLWLASFVLMMEALLGKPRMIFGWAVLATALPWTHLYGVLAAGAQTFAVAWFGFLQRSPCGSRSRASLRWSLVPVAVSIATVGFLFWGHRRFDYGGGGAWIPGWEDLGGLLALAVDGVAAARVHFLDAGRLVPAWLAGVPLAIWGVAAVALAWPILFGLRNARRDPVRRKIAIVSLWIAAGPVLAIWAYAALFGLRVWACKPLLGTAYIVYLWLGVGVAALPRLAPRIAVMAAIIAVNLASLLPFYLDWERWPPSEALRSLAAEIGPGEAVLVQQRDWASVVFFYLPECAFVWALDEPLDGSASTGDGSAGEASREPMPLRIGTVPRSDPILARLQPTDCDDARWVEVTGLRYFGHSEWLHRTRDRWPACLSDVPVRVYGREGWQISKDERHAGSSPSSPSAPEGESDR